MPSYDIGKDVITKWIRRNFDRNSVILDVGACDGKWKKLLPEYTMDAVEIWRPYCEALKPMYRTVYNQNAVDFKYDFYNLVIFGDVIEHMTVDDAKRVMAYAYDRCTDMIIAVPFLYPQGVVDGNPWQEHKQSDLTADIFTARYPGLEVLHDTGANYCFYHKRDI